MPDLLEELTDAIASAIRDHDFPVIPYLVTLLAVKDPDAAQQVLDVIEVAMEMERKEPDANNGE